MDVTTRPARPADAEAICALLLAAAQARASDLWVLAEDAPAAIHAGQGDRDNPIWTRWLVAEAAGQLVGAAHVIRVPVPPIYAAPFGAPGLVMEDSAVASDAPSGTQEALLRAAEACLADAGARVVLVAGDKVPQGYEALTVYYAKVGLEGAPGTVARAEDLPAIAAASADRRAMLERLHPQFWQPHPDAAARFAAWMAKSLTLADRDMFVGGGGYAISQPATRLHVPAAYRLDGIGIVDDFHAPDMARADALFAAAEYARARREDRAMLVVCPAAWTEKRALLERAGYAPALTWSIRVT